MNVQKELMNFSFRETNIDLKNIFPNIKLNKLKEKFEYLVDNNPHQTVFNITKELWNGGYDYILKEFGFWQDKYRNFSGHCHQCTPILGVALKSLGFKVAYLECFRIKESFLKNGIVEKVSPEEEPNPSMKEEFCAIERIPYCCLEVNINGINYYLTGKHLKPTSDGAKALLTPQCYIEMVGVFPHQDNISKSGIYLKTITPTTNPHQLNFNKQIFWMKQTQNDPQAEIFATYLRMNL